MWLGTHFVGKEPGAWEALAPLTFYSPLQPLETVPQHSMILSVDMAGSGPSIFLPQGTKCYCLHVWLMCIPPPMAYLAQPQMCSPPSSDPVIVHGTEAPIPMVSGHKLQRATFHIIHHQL